ncbi:MAG TPA: lysylphosphatidylglycerol synthase transmembrane domain-containing protein [Chitinispirillaceae bacterium]|nr:lysylphosphatidylglycerol synthase transmembrane domain-containing protein [Chitinispirillaceae bacterium]
MLRFTKGFTRILKFIITLLVMVLLVGKLGWDQIVTTISHANPLWLTASLAVFIISGLLGVVQWIILLKNRGIPLKFWNAFRLYFIGLFFNNFIMGGIVGDAVKVATLKSQQGKGMAGLAATFLDRFAGLWAMCGFAVAGSFILLHRGAINNGKIGTAVLALLVTFVMFAGIMIFLVSKPLQKLFFTITDSFAFTRRFRIKEIISEMLIEAGDYHVLVKVAILSVVTQFFRIGVHTFVASSLGLLSLANFQYFFIFVPLMAMLMTIPLPFGVREAVGGTLFTLAGFPTNEAYVMGFLASLVGIGASCLGGLFFVTDKIVIQGKKNEKSIDCSTAA